MRLIYLAIEKLTLSENFLQLENKIKIGDQLIRKGITYEYLMNNEQNYNWYQVLE